MTGSDPKLEVIVRGRPIERHPTPLVFVHGAWHAAWCWDEHFLDFFAGEGYQALAVSLRGHGKSPLAKPLRGVRIADYVEDLAVVVRSLPVKPILIGHSMGAFVVQKYLEAHTVRAGVMLAPVPPRRFLRTALRLGPRHPWPTLKSIVTRSPRQLIATPKLVRALLFTDNTPDGVVTEAAARLQEESHRAYLDMMVLDRVRPERVTAPMLVLGGERDAIFSQRDVRRTAHNYGVQAEFFPGLGHDVMLEPGWRAVAERISFWLDTFDESESDEPV